jgi:hypothetical protein
MPFLLEREMGPCEMGLEFILKDERTGHAGGYHTITVQLIKKP